MFLLALSLITSAVAGEPQVMLLPSMGEEPDQAKLTKMLQKKLSAPVELSEAAVPEGLRDALLPRAQYCDVPLSDAHAAALAAASKGNERMYVVIPASDAPKDVLVFRYMGEEKALYPLEFSSSSARRMAAIQGPDRGPVHVWVVPWPGEEGEDSETVQETLGAMTGRALTVSQDPDESGSMVEALVLNFHACQPEMTPKHLQELAKKKSEVGEGDLLVGVFEPKKKEPILWHWDDARQILQRMHW